MSQQQQFALKLEDVCSQLSPSFPEEYALLSKEVRKEVKVSLASTQEEEELESISQHIPELKEDSATTGKDTLPESKSLNLPIDLVNMFLEWKDRMPWEI